MADRGAMGGATWRTTAADREARWVAVGGGAHGLLPAVPNRDVAMGSGAGGGGHPPRGQQRPGPERMAGFLKGESSPMAGWAWSGEPSSPQQMRLQPGSFYSSSYLWEVHLRTYRELSRQGKEFQK